MSYDAEDSYIGSNRIMAQTRWIQLNVDKARGLVDPQKANVELSALLALWGEETFGSLDGIIDRYIENDLPVH